MYNAGTITATRAPDPIDRLLAGEAVPWAHRIRQAELLVMYEAESEAANAALPLVCGYDEACHRLDCLLFEAATGRHPSWYLGPLAPPYIQPNDPAYQWALRIA